MKYMHTMPRDSCFEYCQCGDEFYREFGLRMFKVASGWSCFWIAVEENVIHLSEIPCKGAL